MGLGLIIGMGAAALLLKGQARLAQERDRSLWEKDLLALRERLQAKEQELESVLEQLAARAADLEQLRESLRGEVERRSTAEEKAGRIPQLEAVLKMRDEQLQDLNDAKSDLLVRVSELKTRWEEERRLAEERMALLAEAQQKLTDAFKALAADALRNNNQSFLELARESLGKFQQAAEGDLAKRQQAIVELVKPVQDSLTKMDTQIQELEKARTGAYASLSQQVQGMLESQNQLRSETSSLVNALRTPAVRGRWGEMQLRRVVEMAGMVDHVDFFEQQSVSTEDGRLRPDLIVRLPGGKNIVVDSKVPLAGYLEALEVRDEPLRLQHLKMHARQIRDHVSALSRKAYWDQFQPTPDFVVLFLPGETFFSAALEQDPTLIDFGVEQHVILATPTTLIALLRTVAYGWRQSALEENARLISDLAQELYKRMGDMGNHLLRLGKNLTGAVDAYNHTIGTLEARVLVTARKFRDLKVEGTDKELEMMAPVDQTARALQSPELLLPTDDAGK